MMNPDDEPFKYAIERLWRILTNAPILRDSGAMGNRQTRNVSLPPHQDAFVDALVSAGRYRTASEVVRDGLRLLEQSEHRRLLEKWIYDGLSEKEAEQLPAELMERARVHFRGLVEAAMQDCQKGRVTDGPAAMRRLREQIEARAD